MAGAEAAAKKKSDLGVRTASAVVMVAVAGAALWFGGWFWTAFVVAIALGVFWEWRGLTVRLASSPVTRGLWNGAGLIYLGISATALIVLRQDSSGAGMVVALLGSVIATDIGAYFAGRTIGGPKIAPRISPSKTWSGLLGGMLAAGIALYLLVPPLCYDNCPSEFDIWLGHLKTLFRDFTWIDFLFVLLMGGLIASVAQAGDFFESWMKRRAGVKDSGALLPGHGGLFDRVDGLLAVMFLPGVAIVIAYAMEPL
jgi:phosphatidate cytidylyltransferase